MWLIECEVVGAVCEQGLLRRQRRDRCLRENKAVELERADCLAMLSLKLKLKETTQKFI
jgi:hypothetical protein